MKKSAKKWLVAAAFLVVIGLLALIAVMFCFNWDLNIMSTDKYITNTYEITDNFSNFSIDTETADIVFTLSTDEKCRVECREDENAVHSVTVRDDTLYINANDSKSWINHIGFNFESPKITINLPRAEYTSLHINESTGDVKIPNDLKFNNIDISLSTGYVYLNSSASEQIRVKASTGCINVENLSSGNLDLTVSTGTVTVSDVICNGDMNVVVTTGETQLNKIECNSLTTTGNTGDISLNNVIASGTVSIARTTGDVVIESSDAAEIFVETDTGDVSGSLLSEKVFITRTDTGDIDVPETVAGGRCKISTDTGDIKLSIK